MNSSDNYAVKYYWEGINQKGETVTLYIYRKNYSGAPLVWQICDLVDLKFQIQGNSSDPNAPIIKTSLQMTLVDSYDAEAKAIGYKYFDGYQKYVYEKHGGWEEFFTPDATAYFVQLYITANNGATHSGQRTVWSGYITPDSWEESLAYRGTITIVARDNLGHLADFDFDKEGDSTWGLVRVGDIIEDALTKINFPMGLSYRTSEGNYNPGMTAVGADVSGELGVTDLRVNVSAFEGKTWWDALENVLDSIGCVLRFTDYNYATIMPLRLMPDMGWADGDPGVINPDMEFYGGSRMLDPGYKEIVEKIDFGQTDKLEYQAADTSRCNLGQNTSVGYALEIKNDHVVDPYGQTSSRTSAISGSAPMASSASGGGRLGIIRALWPDIYPDSYSIQDYTKETEGDGFKNYLFFHVNQGSISWNSSNYSINYQDSGGPSFYMRVKSTQMKIRLDFASPAGFDDNGKLGAYPFRLWKCKYSISYGPTFGNATHYWTGDNWVQTNNPYWIAKTYDPDSEDVTSIEETLTACNEVGEYGYLWFEFHGMVYRTTTYWWSYNSGLVFNVLVSRGIYARLKSVTIESALTKKMVSDTIKTVNNDSYNVRCTRNPMFGCIPQDVGFVHPSNYKNAFFYIDTNGFPQLAPYLWKWSDRSTSLGFPVQIALQILQYHATPLEVLEGPSGLVEKTERLTFDDNYGYKNVLHLLLSATYNLLTARFDSAIFRAWVAFSNASTRSYVAAASAPEEQSGESEETETIPDGVTPLELSDSSRARLDRIQTVELAASIEEETELQEETPTAAAVPELTTGQLLEIADESMITRTFTAPEQLT